MIFLSSIASALFLLPTDALGASRNAPIGATYFLTNNETGNALVVHNVLQGGTVHYSHSVPTGGLGAIAVFSPLTPDGLRGQGCVAIGGTHLYAPGSDTVAMFQINPSSPSDIKMVGKPVNSGGNFPSSIAVSSKTGQVCTVNGGVINGVQCFTATSRGLVQKPNTNRLISFSQTNPPTHNNLLYSTSQILFSPDGSKLIVSVKGLPQPKVPGYLAIWDVMSDGSLSENFRSFPAPSQVGALNFGTTALRGKEGYVVADPTAGAIIYDFSQGYTPQTYKAQNFALPGQQITCWASYSSKSNSYFMSDFGTQIVFEATIDPQTLRMTVVNKFQLSPSYVITDNFVGTVGNHQYVSPDIPKK